METTPCRQLSCDNNSELENVHAQSGGSSSIGFLDCQGDELQASERKRGCGVIDRVSGQV